MRPKVMKTQVIPTTFATPKRNINALPNGAIAARVRNIREIGVVTSEIVQPNSSVIGRIKTCGILKEAEENTVVKKARTAITHP